MKQLINRPIAMSTRCRAVWQSLSMALDKKGNKIELSVTGALISNHEDLVFEGALQGLGILYAHDDDRIHEAIARGQLKRLLAAWSPTVPGLFLYYSNRHHPQPALRAFIDCLLDRDVTG